MRERIPGVDFDGPRFHGDGQKAEVSAGVSNGARIIRTGLQGYRGVGNDGRSRVANGAFHYGGSNTCTDTYCLASLRNNMFDVEEYRTAAHVVGSCRLPLRRLQGGILPLDRFLSVDEPLTDRYGMHGNAYGSMPLPLYPLRRTPTPNGGAEMRR